MYDHNQYTELGIGERVESQHYKLNEQGEPAPVSNHDIGRILHAEDDEVFLRLVTAPVFNPQTHTVSDQLAEQLGITTVMGRKALAVAIENIKVLDAKQKDYGSGNIAAFGEFGVLVRTWDKISRLRNLLTNVQDPKNESVEDSWLDLSNYAIIAVLCRRGEWR